MAPQHKDVIAVSTGRPAPADRPAPAPGPVSTHPGPDLDTLRRVRDGLAALPASSTEGNTAA